MLWSANVEAVARVECWTSAEQQAGVRPLVIETPYLHRIQLRHFLVFNVLPFVGTIVALGFAFIHPIQRGDVFLFFGMWLLTGLGVSVGYHRLFTHRSFRTTTPVRAALAIAGSMAGLGPLISWAAMHRRHHQCADHEGDMHSPNLHGESLRGRIRGFLHAHVKWMIRHEYPNIFHYTPDLLEDRAILRISRRYQAWVLLGLAIPTILGGLISGSWRGALTGFLWGGPVRMFVVAQSISALNSVLHSIGSRPFTLRDNSRNNWLLGLATWGEGWHHNHHAFPTSASFGLAWYRADVSYWFILLLQSIGLAWDVIVPTREQIAATHRPQRQTDWLRNEGKNRIDLS